jgi:chromosomal replication initiation ATPase DnaA
VSPFAQELEDRGLLDLAQRICKPFALLVEELHGSSRYATCVEARRLFARELRDEYKWSYSQIARLLDKDHTSILSLIGGGAERRKQRTLRLVESPEKKTPR